MICRKSLWILALYCRAVYEAFESTSQDPMRVLILLLSGIFMYMSFTSVPTLRLAFTCWIDSTFLFQYQSLRDALIISK